MVDFGNSAEEIDQAIAGIIQVNWSAVGAGVLSLVLCLWLLRSGGLVRWLLGAGGLAFLVWLVWQSLFPDEGVGMLPGE
jgi:hypothetical protein